MLHFEAKIKVIVLLSAFILNASCFGQVLIKDESVAATYAHNPSSILELASTKRGLLIPRMSTSSRTSIAAYNSLLVFDTDLKKFCYYLNSKWYLVNPFQKDATSATTSYNGSLNVSTLKVNGYSNGAFATKGMIVIWSGTGDAVPNGWALCDSSLVNGERLPDLRSKFVMGSSSTAGSMGGRNSITLSVANLPQHSHSGSDFTVSGGSHSHTVNTETTSVTGRTVPNGTGTGILAGGARSTNTFSENHTHSENYFTGSVGLTGAVTPTAVDLRPPYYVLAYIIKL